MSTKGRLAQVLADAGLQDMAERALKGYYDDYESPLATPIMQLVADLRASGRDDLARRAIEGEWEGTREEADAWFQREGRHLL